MTKPHRQIVMDDVKVSKLLWKVAQEVSVGADDELDFPRVGLELVANVESDSADDNVNQSSDLTNKS